MATSPKLNWPFPDENDQSWYQKFVSLMQAMDAAGYAGREDRSTVATKGGTFAWNATSGALSWSADINIFSPISGFLETLPAGSVTLTAGQCLYVNLSRSPSGAVTLSAQVGSTIPNTDDAFVIAVRNGTSVYFRNGSALGDGGTGVPFDGGTGGGGATITTDGVTVQGNGSGGSPVAIKAVQHTADLTGNGTVASNLGLSTTGVAAASYTNANITVDNKGRVTAASNGSSGGGGVSPSSMSYMQDFIEGVTPNFQVVTGGGATKTAIVDSSTSGPASWTKTPIGVALMEVDGTIANAEVYIDIANVSGHVTPSATILGEVANDINAGILTLQFRLAWSGDDQSTGAGVHTVFAFGQYTQPASGLASFWNLLGFGIGKDVFGNNHWWALTGNAGGGVGGLIQHDTAVAVDNSASHPHVFKIVYNPSGPLTTWYIDGVSVATDSSAMSGSLLPSLDLKAALSGTGSTASVYVDYIYVELQTDRSTN